MIVPSTTSRATLPQKYQNDHMNNANNGTAAGYVQENSPAVSYVLNQTQQVLGFCFYVMAESAL